MALPAQRAAVLQGNIALIEAQLSTEEVERTMQLSVIANMKARVAAAAAKDKNLIFRGQCWLICSFALFTLAVALGF